MALPAWAADAWVRAQPYAEKLAVWRGYESELETLTILAVGIAFYTALVFTFYQNISRRRPFELKMSNKAGWEGRFGRTLQRALIFPVTSFLYFAVLAIALFVLAKPEISVNQLMLTSMAVIVSVRVIVYLSEGMSNDLAKLVPLSLLAVVLVDPSYLKITDAWSRLLAATQLGPLLARYFLLFIVLEAVMSTARWSVLRIGKKYSDLRYAPAKKKDASFSVHVKEGSAPGAKPPQK